MIQKYTFMQQNVEKRLLGLKAKIPEMRSSLDTVRFLRRKRSKTESLEEDPDQDQDQETLSTTFSLADTLYAHAILVPAEIPEVYLWLGANVMVSYPLGEAEELLEGKLGKAREGIVACEEDLEFLRVQITTLEVATARVYNWDVGERRKRGEGAS
jgi:prefoldin subunit 5